MPWPPNLRLPDLRRTGYELCSTLGRSRERPRSDATGRASGTVSTSPPSPDGGGPTGGLGTACRPWDGGWRCGSTGVSTGTACRRPESEEESGGVPEDESGGGAEGASGGGEGSMRDSAPPLSKDSL